ENNQPDGNGKPGGLSALGHGITPPPRAVEPGSARRGAIRQKGELVRHHHKQRTTQRQSGQRQGTQMTNDRRIDKHVQGGCRKHTQRRQRQLGNPTWPDVFYITVFRVDCRHTVLLPNGDAVCQIRGVTCRLSWRCGVFCYPPLPGPLPRGERGRLCSWLTSN